jgi:hypothetical protein
LLVELRLTLKVPAVAVAEQALLVAPVQEQPVVLAALGFPRP